MKFTKVLALDVGDKRIGIARASYVTKISQPLTTIEHDTEVLKKLKDIVYNESIDLIVIGKPRSLNGTVTEQTKKSEAFAARLDQFNIPVVFQDESLTSVKAEEHLKASGKEYEKSDIDKHAAAIILRDFLEQQS